MSNIADRFHELPRAFRWLVLAVLFVVVVLGWDATLGAVMRDWNRDADRIVSDVRTVRAGHAGRLQTELSALESTIVGLGPVGRPGHDNEERAAFTALMVDVLTDDAFRVRDENYELKGGHAMVRKEIANRIVPGKRLGKLSGEVSFTASQEDTIAILAAFEEHPAVESVSAVRIIKNDDDLKVVLELEAWVQVKGRRS